MKRLIATMVALVALPIAFHAQPTYADSHHAALDGRISPVEGRPGPLTSVGDDTTETLRKLSIAGSNHLYPGGHFSMEVKAFGTPGPATVQRAPGAVTSTRTRELPFALKMISS